MDIVKTSPNLEKVSPGFMTLGGEYEFTFSVFSPRRGPDLCASCTLHKGTFSEFGFGQNLVEERRKEFNLGSEAGRYFANDIVDWIMNFRRGHLIRINSGKYMDDKFKAHYQGHFDINLKEVKTNRDKQILEWMIRYLIHDNPGGCHLVRSNDYDENKVRTLLALQNRGRDVPIQIQKAVHR